MLLHLVLHAPVHTQTHTHMHTHTSYSAIHPQTHKHHLTLSVSISPTNSHNRISSFLMHLPQSHISFVCQGLRLSERLHHPSILRLVKTTHSVLMPLSSFSLINQCLSRRQRCLNTSSLLSKLSSPSLLLLAPHSPVFFSTFTAYSAHSLPLYHSFHTPALSLFISVTPSLSSPHFIPLSSLSFTRMSANFVKPSIGRLRQRSPLKPSPRFLLSVLPRSASHLPFNYNFSLVYSPAFFPVLFVNSPLPCSLQPSPKKNSSFAIFILFMCLISSSLVFHPLSLLLPASLSSPSLCTQPPPPPSFSPTHFPAPLLSASDAPVRWLSCETDYHSTRTQHQSAFLFLLLSKSPLQYAVSSTRLNFRVRLEHYWLINWVNIAKREQSASVDINKSEETTKSVHY